MFDQGTRIPGFHGVDSSAHYRALSYREKSSSSTASFPTEGDQLTFSTQGTNYFTSPELGTCRCIHGISLDRPTKNSRDSLASTELDLWSFLQGFQMLQLYCSSAPGQASSFLPYLQSFTVARSQCSTLGCKLGRRRLIGKNSFLQRSWGFEYSAPAIYCLVLLHFDNQRCRCGSTFAV